MENNGFDNSFYKPIIAYNSKILKFIVENMLKIQMLTAPNYQSHCSKTDVGKTLGLVYTSSKFKRKINHINED